MFILFEFNEDQLYLKLIKIFQKKELHDLNKWLYN